MLYFNADSIQTIDSQPELIRQFTIYDASKILLEPRKYLISNIKIEEVIKNIESYEKTTGIMIGDFFITESDSLFLFIFDNRIIIINEIDLHEFRLFFDRSKEKMIIFYLNTRCYEKIQEMQAKDKSITHKKNSVKIQTNLPDLLLEKISECIIKKSQLRTLNRYNGLIPNNKSIQKKFDNDFINITHFVGTNSVFLSYNIRDQFLYILKYFDKYSEESKIRFAREVSFYENHNGNNPYICKYFGSDKEKLIIVTEFIEGQTLQDFINNKKEKLDIDQRLTIILEIMSVVEYLHVNGFMYRDLKSNNIIIDCNQKAKLIDFDQIKEYEKIQQTGDVGNDVFASPEQLSSNYYSFKTDIYSLGKIISFIFSDCEKSESDWEFYNKGKLCLENSPELRPTIGNLLTHAFFYYLNSKNPQLYFKEIFEVRKKLFDFSIKSKIDKDKIYDLYTFIGICYTDGDFISQDVDKAIEFLEFTSEQDDSDAQFCLANIYLEDQYSKKNITKAIEYLELSSKNNNSLAQCQLGDIYYDGEYVQQDIEKAIQLYNLSSIQNNSIAQCSLGQIYYEGEYVQQDVKRAIELFKLSANNKNSQSQAYLGQIYYEGKYVQRDLERAIHYLELSSIQNNSFAQRILYRIFNRGEYIISDFKKIIHFLDLSSKKNKPFSQFLLGKIYYEGKYIQRDIERAIHYLTLSANQNDDNAQHLLGLIYYEGKYVQQDIDKAIILLIQSADQYNSNAQYLLGVIYNPVNIGFSYNDIFNSLLRSQSNLFDVDFFNLFIQSISKPKSMEKHIQYTDINESIYYLELSSNQNNSLAQFSLGYLYLIGINVQQNTQKAISLLDLSSNNKNSDAQFLLGILYLFDEFINKNINKAIHYLTLSSNNQNLMSQYLLANLYMKSGEYNKSIYFLELLGKQNNSYIQLILGVIYAFDNHIPHDIKKAIHYLTLSSNQNNAQSQYILGAIYYQGKIVPHNINKAIKYFTLSSNQNNPNAHFYLGLIYYEGIFIKQDIDKAIHYLNLSSNQNNSQAQLYLGKIYYENKYVPIDINKALLYFKFSSNNNNSEAQYYLGLIFYKGIHVPRNINKAIFYFSLSSEQYDSDAQFYLGMMHYDGKYIPKNVQKAIHYFKESSSLNNLQSKNNLGVIYKNGDGVKKNIYHAIEYFEEAVQQNDTFAILNLARIYYFGIDIEQNIPKFFELLEKLSKNNDKFAEIFLLLFQIDESCKKLNETYNICRTNHYSELISNLMSRINGSFNSVNVLVQLFKAHDFFYTDDDKIHDYYRNIFSNFFKQSPNQTNIKKDINKDFYDGFLY